MYVAEMLSDRRLVIVWCIFENGDPTGYLCKNTRSTVEREGTRPTQRLHFVLACTALLAQATAGPATLFA
jgi:hypothetical protein